MEKPSSGAVASATSHIIQHHNVEDFTTAKGLGALVFDTGVGGLFGEKMN